MSEHKCEGKVWGNMRYLPCGKIGRYEHEGQWYCKTHHPPTMQEKLDARNKKWREEFESRERAMREADEARAEMKRKAAAYERLTMIHSANMVVMRQALEALEKTIVLHDPMRLGAITALRAALAQPSPATLIDPRGSLGEPIV